jgi:hypothetical protein
MLVLKIIKWLLVAVFAGPVLSVVATCIVALPLLLVLLPGGLEILLLEWERATRWGGQVAAPWEAPQGVGVDSKPRIGH